MDKSELLRAVRDGHARVAALIEGLTDEDLRGEAPGMPGWTRKDVVAHLEFWHRHSADVLAGMRTGVDPYADWPTSINPFNARVLAENRDRPAADVRAGEAASFERLLAAVEAAGDDELFGPSPVAWQERPAADEIAGDTYTHYPDHLAQLTAG